MPKSFRTLIIIVAMAGMLVPSAWAGRGKKKTIKGYLVDVACVTERSSELGTLGIVHTKRCLQMPDCERSGYAVLTGDRKIIRFDAAASVIGRLTCLADSMTTFSVVDCGSLTFTPPVCM